VLGDLHNAHLAADLCRRRAAVSMVKSEHSLRLGVAFWLHQVNPPASRVAIHLLVFQAEQDAGFRAWVDHAAGTVGAMTE